MNLKSIVIIISSLIIVPLPRLGLADNDLSQGEQLHQQECTFCHDSQVYTRPNRRVSSLEGLSNQMHRCINANDVEWTEQQQQQVIEYLNQTYYHF